MRWSLTLFAIPVAMSGFFACGDEGASDPRLTWGGATAPPLDHPAVEVPRPSAGTRRLSTDQWRASFPVVFGNDMNGKPITWTLPSGAEALSPSIARSLGEPDYLGVTEESLDPSLLYTKFADDAARSLCAQVLDADAMRLEKATRAFLRFVEPTDTPDTNGAGVEENLRYLKLRFHAVYIQPTDIAGTQPLRTLLASSISSSSAGTALLKVRDGWMAVCVALTIAPEFHIY